MLTCYVLYQKILFRPYIFAESSVTANLPKHVGTVRMSQWHTALSRQDTSAFPPWSDRPHRSPVPGKWIGMVQAYHLASLFTWPNSSDFFFEDTLRKLCTSPIDYRFAGTYWRYITVNNKNELMFQLRGRGVRVKAANLSL